MCAGDDEVTIVCDHQWWLLPGARGAPLGLRSSGLAFRGGGGGGDVVELTKCLLTLLLCRLLRECAVVAASGIYMSGLGIRNLELNRRKNVPHGAEGGTPLWVWFSCQVWTEEALFRTLYAKVITAVFLPRARRPIPYYE